MTFDYPWLLLLLLLALPGLLLWLRSARKRKERIEKFAESGFVDRLVLGNSPKLRFWHFLLFFAGIFFVILSIAGPKIAGGKEKIKISGIDLMIVLDISNSMRANDIQPNRLERAKLALQDVISNVNGDRVGIVVFAGQAYMNMPLSDDMNAAQMVLQSVSPEMITVQGTAIGDAIDRAVDAFPRDEEDKSRGRAIIVISDGENHEDDAIKAAQRATENGIIVCTIGIGTAEGSRIPEVDDKGNLTGYKTDDHGQEIVTKLNEPLLQQVASEGRGVYVHASNTDLGVGKVYSLLQGLSKTTKETWQYKDFTPLYPWLAALSILLLIFEPLLPEGKRNDSK